jgi:hypothetical protein
MKPSLLVQIFKTHRPTFTPRAYMLAGGILAGLAFAFAFIFHWS